MTGSIFSMTQCVLAGMFRSSQARECAEEGLLALGISESARVAISSEPGPPELGQAELSNRITDVAAFSIPEEDLHIYLEGLRTGRHLLVTCVPASLAEEAADVFERCEAINILEQVHDWLRGTDAASSRRQPYGAHDTKGYSLGPSGRIGKVRNSIGGTPPHPTQGGKDDLYSTAGISVQNEEKAEYVGNLGHSIPQPKTVHDTAGFSIGPDRWNRRDIQKVASNKKNPYDPLGGSPARWLRAGRVRGYSVQGE
jgi:hypothetical protein